MPAHGAFVWYDLMSPAPESSIAFYRAAVGWETEAWKGPMPYTLWTVRKTPIGGVMQLPADAGAPPHWLGYVSTPDLRRSLGRVEALGGKVLMPPQDIPDTGIFAVVSDPQGAAFALYQPLKDDGPTFARGEPGAIGWAELNTTDWESAWKFYSELLGWRETSKMDMGDGFGTYFMFKAQAAEGAASIGGMSNAAIMMNAPPHWLYYINVADMNAALERIRGAGGQVLNGPMDVPENAQIAQCLDPQGAAFAVYAE